MGSDTTVSTFEYYIAEAENGLCRVPRRVADDALLRLRRDAARITALEAELAATREQHDVALFDHAVRAGKLRVAEAAREAAEAEAARLREALAKMIAHYVSLVSSGDCGIWNPEEEPEVVAARAALGAGHD